MNQTADQKITLLGYLVMHSKKRTFQVKLII